MAKPGKNTTMNTFQEGMKMDIDKLNQPNSAFRYGLNGRLIYNRDGTYAWETERGNLLSFTMEPDSNSGLAGNEYEPIGWTGKSNLIIIFSVDRTTNHSEIGIFIVNENGTSQYKTMFNDFNDPSGDLLNFKLKNQIEARFVYETDNYLRSYWVDGVKPDSNVPRVFTFEYNNTLPENDLTAYTPVSDSVHDINLQSQYNMGIVKYIKTVSGGGNVLSGSYQYTYRLVTKVGYQTPWKPLTQPVIVSTDGINASNPWLYEMEGSEIDSGKSVEIEVKGIDQRYDEIEVCFAYLTTDNVPTQAAIFEITQIDGESMTFVHSSMNGQPLAIEDLPVYFQGIAKAKTLNIKDESLYIGNTVESTFALNDLEPVLENLTVKPYFKNIRSDEYPLNSFADGRDSAPNSTPPIHRQSVVGSSSAQISFHNSPGGTESYSVIDEYSNYKGTQISHLNKGYFRGETYRFGIVFFDLIGYQSFVTHLFDIVMPEQFNNTYTATRLKSDGTTVALPTITLTERAWTTCNYGAYSDASAIVGLNGSDPNISYLRIMGLSIDGIDISTIKDQISGFMIVRTTCDNSILFQGLAMPCVSENNTTYPAPFGHDRWYDQVNGNNPDDNSTVSDLKLIPGKSPTLGDWFDLRPNHSVLYAPDIDFGYSATPNVQTADRIKLVSTCYQPGHSLAGTETQEYVNQYFTWEEDSVSADHGRCGVRKLYYTKNDAQGYADSPATINNPYPAHGVEANIEYLLNMSIGAGRDNYDGTLDLKNQCDFEDGGIMGYEAGKELRAWGKENSLFIKHGDYTPFTPAVTSKPWSPFFQTPSSDLPDPSYMGSWIMNYLRPNNNPYGGISESSLERTIFFSTGHFQPVNNPTFDTQGMPGDDVFDNVEVWGGDCILDYFGFTRLYPRYKDPVSWNSQPFEYSIGELFPLESRVHHPLRNAPSQQNPIFSDVGTRPQKQYEDEDTSWPDGMYHISASDELREEFDINSVLFYEESVMLYAPKPLRFNISDHFPVRWRYTPSKFYGDQIDTWRIFQVNDFDDLNGEYGQITSSIFMFNQIYSFQESAFGRLRASDRALIESANQGSLTTGIGEKLDGVDYINTEFGNQHQWSLFGSGKAGYWVDVNQRKLCRFAQDGFVVLSDLRGLHQWAENELRYYEGSDTPVSGKGISGIFDYQNNVALWSFVRDRKIEIGRDTSLYVVSSETQVLGNKYVIVNNLDYLEIDAVTAINAELVIPINTCPNGTNEIFAFYIKNVSFVGLWPLDIFVEDASGKTLLLTVAVGDVVFINREHITDNWSFTLVDEGKFTKKDYNTLSFNELSNSFVGFHSYQSNIFFSAKNFTIAYNTNYTQEFYSQNIGRIGEYYGILYNSMLEPIVSEAAMYSKVFDNFKGNVNHHFVNTFTDLHMITDSTYNLLQLIGDNRKAYKEDILRIPLRTQSQLYRTRGKQLTYILVVSNEDFDISRISSINTDYRISNRI